MKKFLFAAIITFLLCAPALAKESPESMLAALPDKAGNFEAEQPQTYQAKELGASRGYNSQDFIALTMYLYDLGENDIPDGIDSEVILAVKKQTMDEILGFYQNVKIIDDKPIDLSLGQGKTIKVLHSSFSCEMPDPYTGGVFPAVSETYMIGLKGYICKVRVSYPPEIYTARKDAVAKLVGELVGALKK